MSSPLIINVIPATKIPSEKNQVFSYLAPPAKKLPTGFKFQPGQEVLIPLRNRQLRAVVISTSNKIPRGYQLKPISKILSEQVIWSKAHLQLAEWIADYYQTSLGLVIKTMLWPRLKKTRLENKMRKSRTQNTSLPSLTVDQQKVWRPIAKVVTTQHYQAFLLHGVTGSGKTEIYQLAIQQTIKQNKQVILLVPEISLTPQNIQRFAASFGQDQLAVLHSRLTAGEKFQAWQKICTGQAKIVIGPRSAVFAPAVNLGLIIVDEEHDASYKQYDQNPRYHARAVALKLAQLASIPIILGSATPSLESYYQAKNKQHTLLELPRRFTGQQQMPSVEIVDMRTELKKGNFSIFSEKLQTAIQNTLEHRKQTLLFLNRRGAATFVMCRDCGHVLECPHCDISLTYHLTKKISGQNLICHHCNFRQVSPTLCPRCHSQFIKYFGTGTQKVEQEIKKIFPSAKIARADRDTMRDKEAHSKIYHDFAAGRYDILIGTQMITKGWDLPGVELVGIVSADVLFNFPDFRSNERAFQLLTQVAGRAGRGTDPGQVILQTYHPANRVLRAAAAHDYQQFWQAESAERKSLCYPPLVKLAKIIFTHPSAAKVEQIATAAARDINQIIKQNHLAYVLLGPAPAFLGKIREKYYWNVILKIPPTQQFNQTLSEYLASQNCTVDIDPEDLL